MKILFLTLLDFSSINEHNIYTDLLREFCKHGHYVCVISPCERRKKQRTKVIDEYNSKILKLKTGNIQKTNIIEKGISTISVESKFTKGIKKYFSDVKFDLIIYSTPPITLQKAVTYVKKRDGAKTYLLLKDIFPQNAVDMKILQKHGIKGILYKYFRMKEKKLYAISDHIGCMSQANCDYVIKHNPRIDSSRIEVCPNCIDIHNISVSTQKRDEIRNKYGIPINKKVFVYGGNLGKPQGIDFLIECLKSQKNNNAIYFLIIGTGTEFTKLDNYAKMSEQNNLKVMSTLPRADFETLVNTCDVGLIFLDKCFTIPNFPSRLLSYMQAKIPVLAVTDVNTDVGKVIVDGGFGWWCESNDIKNFKQKIEDIFKDNLIEKGIKARAYLIDNYSAEKSYEIITKHMN